MNNVDGEWLCGDRVRYMLREGVCCVVIVVRCELDWLVLSACVCLVVSYSSRYVLVHIHI